MSRPYFDTGYDGDIPLYPADSNSPRQPTGASHGHRPPPRFDQASQSPRDEHSMRPNLYGAHNGQNPGRYQSPYSNAAAQVSVENLYDGTAYEPAEGESMRWPLPPQPYATPPRTGSPSKGPRQPPQRPQRPDFQQSIPSPPRPPPHIASADRQYRHPPNNGPYPTNENWSEDEYTSALPQMPRSQISNAAQYSPGSDPYAAYPSPQQAIFHHVNRRPPLGPPPSSRRGPASYYPQMAPVHPIVEESDSQHGSSHRSGRNSKTSFASSNAIPIGVPSYYLEDRTSSVPSMPDPPQMSDEEVDYSPIDPAVEQQSHVLPKVERGRQDSSPDPTGLVRQASLGRKSKPTLTTVKPGDRIRKDSTGDGLVAASGYEQSTPAPSNEQSLLGQPGRQADAGAQAAVHSADDTRVGGATSLAAALRSQHSKSRDNVSVRTASSDVRPPIGLGSNAGFDGANTSPSDSEADLEKQLAKELEILPSARPEKPAARELPKSSLSNEIRRPRSPTAPDPRIVEILKNLEKGGALTPSDATSLKSPASTAKSPTSLKTPKSGLSASAERIGKRRPPRLNVEAVRDAEARGSLTSLPDLIRRATRLASNLDRGKTASRLGMNWFEGAEEGEKSRNLDTRHSGDISDILASFPPPHDGTPTGDRRRWSNRQAHSHLKSDSTAAGEGDGKRKRRCCGMPLWLFLLLLVALILIVAAAIIVPVCLVVIPHQNHHNSASPATPTACKNPLTCENGGANVLGSDGNCRCLCVNGYTGSTCTAASSEGCTTTSVGGVQNATIGEDLPRLFEGAQSNFSVPLDGETLLGLFSSMNTSCRVENSLVVFYNQQNSKRDVLAPPAALVLRQDSTTTAADADATSTPSSTTSSPGYATTNGIIYQTGSPTPSSSSSSSSPSATSNPSSPSSSSGSSGNSTQYTFAGISVLYILQLTTDLQSADTAQENINRYFQYGTTTTGMAIDARNVSVGSGFTVDLVDYKIGTANGSVVGGT